MMEMKTLNRSAFTIIELVIAILLIGILAAVAVPVFVDLSQKAIESKEAAVVGAVQEGLHLQEMQSAVTQP